MYSRLLDKFLISCFDWFEGAFLVELGGGEMDKYCFFGISDNLLL